jgi:hypothetical protein
MSDERGAAEKVYFALTGIRIGRPGRYGVLYLQKRDDVARKHPTEKPQEVWRCEHAHRLTRAALMCAHAEARRRNARLEQR